jgi:hypothetical protein
VVGKERVLKDGTPNITTREVVADLDGRCELPLLFTVEGRNGDTAGNVNGFGHLGNGLEGTLNTIVDTVEQTGTELDGQGLSGSVDGVTDHDAGCLLVNLNRGLVAIDSDNLTNEVVVSYSDQLVHGNTNHVLSNDDRTGDGVDFTSCVSIVLVGLAAVVGSLLRSHVGRRNWRVIGLIIR